MTDTIGKQVLTIADLRPPSITVKNLFWPFGSFKNAILLSLSDPSSAGNFARSWKTFSTITICNIKSIQQTKLRKMA